MGRGRPALRCSAEVIGATSELAEPPNNRLQATVGGLGGAGRRVGGSPTAPEPER